MRIRRIKRSKQLKKHKNKKFYKHLLSIRIFREAKSEKTINKRLQIENLMIEDNKDQKVLIKSF